MLGDGALIRLKSEVQAYAIDHTYKETARKFGIHHSTVSGWIKKSSLNQDQITSWTINSATFKEQDDSHHDSHLKRSGQEVDVFGQIKIQNDEREPMISSTCSTLNVENALFFLKKIVFQRVQK